MGQRDDKTAPHVRPCETGCSGGGAGRGAEDSVGSGRGQTTAETRAQSDAAMRFDCNCAREIVKDGGEEL